MGATIITGSAGIKIIKQLSKNSLRMTPEQIAQSQNLIDDFVGDAQEILDKVDSDHPLR